MLKISINILFASFEIGLGVKFTVNAEIDKIILYNIALILNMITIFVKFFISLKY
jgi:hypothetical protein